MSLPGGQYYALYARWDDGRKVQLYSRDRKSSRSKTKNIKTGMVQLLKKAQKYEDEGAIIIQIYDHREGNPPNGRILFNWNMGKIIDNYVDEVLSN